MISAGVEGQIPPYMMTYPERWGAPKQEFVRPAPKPLPSRYNGVSSSAPNGTRVAHSTRPISHHQPPAPTPVNLTQHKDEIPEEQQYYAPRVFQPHTFNHYNPFPGLYQPYPLLRPSTYVSAPPLSPLDTYSPTTPTGNGSFLSPQVPPYSPPTAMKSGQNMISREKVKAVPPPPFKVPPGKEGSMKHRYIGRADDAPMQNESRKRMASATIVSPPRSPAKTLNNNVSAAKFKKGSLIELANGKFRNVEDMRTEDFISSAQVCPELRLAESTVVKIDENPITGTATITLSYSRAQVEVESPLEHPFFVIGQGWASCNVDRTLHSYGLNVHRLRVGDVLISLTPRQAHSTNSIGNGSTIITTATSTAMTAHQISSTAKDHSTRPISHHPHYMNNLIKSPKDNYNSSPAQPAPLSPESMRKRRWSAPDESCDDEEQQKQHAVRRMRIE